MIWVTGCSHAFGSDLADKKKAWPYLLGKHLGIDCINNSMPGSSNERIVYQSLKATPADLFVISWTYIERFTRYKSNDNSQINFNPHGINSDLSTKHYYKEYTRLHYKYWYNELYSFKLWLQQIILLQSFLEKNNQPYLMVNAAPNNLHKWVCKKENFIKNIKELINIDIMSDDQIFDSWEEIQKYYDLINKETFFNIESYYLTQYCKIYPIGITGHLLDEGHKKIAEDLYIKCSKLIHLQ